MKKLLILSAIVASSLTGMAQESDTGNKATTETTAQSPRLAQLDQFWDELARTVKEGDLEGYASKYHEDAVVVFGTRTSVPIEIALEGWKQGFLDTKEGKAKSDVEFRFSERVGDESTAYETGMFYFTLTDSAGKPQEHYAFLEALLVKKNGSWKCLMEYQKSPATKADWDALK